MMKAAKEIMSKDVATINPHLSVAEAIRRMRERHIGSLLVEKVSLSDTWGVITQNDVVQKVVAKGQDPERVKVNEVMSKPISIVRPDTPLQGCAQVMARERIRRVFVFDGQDVVGVISANDIFDTL
jgi:CBS domain-containing protein